MAAYKEASFPLNYRETEVKRIMDALYRLRSIAVIGLAGMGKSNLLRFVASHVEARSLYLRDRAASFVFVLVDCNRIDSTERAVLEELCDQLVALGIPSGIKGRIRQGDDRVRQLRTTLQSQFQNLETGQNVCIIFDPIDHTGKQLAPQFPRFLRSLRDVRKNVCFVFGSRRPLDPLPELDELFDEPCWVRPLDQQDALDSIARDEKRLGAAFDEKEKKKLIRVTGGHPGLLKNAAELLHTSFVDPKDSPDDWASRTLESNKIREVCQDLWNDLTTSEKQALKLRARKVPLHELDPEAVKFLLDTGLLVQGLDGQAACFSMLFGKFVERQELDQVIRITVDPENKLQIRSWKCAQERSLTADQFRLLSHMARNPEQVFTRSQLWEAIWPGEQPAALDAIEQHIRRLRRQVNPILRELTGDTQYNFIVAVRGRGYKLNTKPQGEWRIEFEVRGS
jgi:hypothetical protein